MKTVILCGGQGTRMREATETLPKPLVPVGGRPILWHIMQGYARFGFNDFVICLGYLGHMIKDYFLKYEAMNHDFTVEVDGGLNSGPVYHHTEDARPMSVTLAETGIDAMTGARVKRAARYLDGDRFMVTYGDGVSDVDVSKVVDFHRSHGKLATITSVQPYSRFGMLDLSDDGQVHHFVEKPKLDNWINIGFMVFEKAALDYFSDDASCVMERGPLENLAQDGQLMAYRHAGFFYSMDTYREYQILNDLWQNGDAPWKTW